MSESQQRYRVVEKLESGGMAEVFRAESEGLQGFKKQVAIKRVLPHLSEKKKFISMFLDEARLSAQLSHSNCVQVFDIGVGDNAYFIVMEFVDGANLKSIAESLKKQGKDFPVSAAAFIAHEITKGLSYAHDMRDSNGRPLKIVHRDMSPPNVLITKHGEIKIVDFGLAKANSQLERSEPGIIKGKFSYLSPEAAMGKEVDHRTDIFAVGIILWELLTGQRLFLGDTDFQTVKKVQQAVIPSAAAINTRVPPELERIVNRALARDVDARYATARDLGQDLSKFMFSYGQPVSTYDIATLVQSAMRDRQTHRQPQGSIIDKLIDEALLEFTSLDEDEGQKGGAPRAKSVSAEIPLSADAFVDTKNWAQEISSPRAHPPSASLPTDIFQSGNLSALEDDQYDSAPGPNVPAPPSSSKGSAGSQPLELARPMTPYGQLPTTPLASAPATPEAAPKKKMVLGAAIGVVVLIAAAAGAWFSHLIPHH